MVGITRSKVIFFVGKHGSLLLDPNIVDKENPAKQLNTANILWIAVPESSQLCTLTWSFELPWAKLKQRWKSMFLQKQVHHVESIDRVCIYIYIHTQIIHSIIINPAIFRLHRCMVCISIPFFPDVFSSPENIHKMWHLLLAARATEKSVESSSTFRRTVTTPAGPNVNLAKFWRAERFEDGTILLMVQKSGVYQLIW